MSARWVNPVAANPNGIRAADPARAITVAFDDRVVRLLDGEHEVARHARSFGRKQVIEDPAHRAALLERRRLGRDLRGRDRLRAVCPAIDQLIARYVSDRRHSGPAVYRLSNLLDMYGDTTFRRRDRRSHRQRQQRPRRGADRLREASPPSRAPGPVSVAIPSGATRRSGETA